MPGIKPVGSFPVTGEALSSSSLTIVGTLTSPAPTIMGYPARTFTASNGTAPYSYSATGLPSGLSINSSTGVISGTVAAGGAGSYSVVVTATDAAFNSVSTPTLTLVIYELAPWSIWASMSPLITRKAAPSIAVEFEQGIPLALTNVTIGVYVRSSKFVGYAALANPQSAASAAKLLGYTVLSAPLAAASVSKFTGYAVLQIADTFLRRDMRSRIDELPPLPLKRSSLFVQGMNLPLLSGRPDEFYVQFLM